MDEIKLIYLNDEPFLVRRTPAANYRMTGDDIWSHHITTGYICRVGEEDSVHDLPPNERA